MLALKTPINAQKQKKTHKIQSRGEGFGRLLDLVDPQLGNI